MNSITLDYMKLNTSQSI